MTEAARVSALREAPATRVVVADGAMGTMLQAHDPTLEDFEQLEGCNEILDVTRPDIVRSVHEEYFAAGAGCVETHTFGANHTAASEYEIAHRVHELSQAGARTAREAADEFAARDGHVRWVLGSIGPGTKPPTLGHVGYATIRDVGWDVATDNPVPSPPFWGTRVIKGIRLKEYASWLDEGALSKGQWGLKQARTGEGPTYEEPVETDGRPRLRGLLDRLQTDNLLEAAVVHGCFPCVSKDDDLIILDEQGNERTRFTFPRQRRGRRLCLADFFRPEEAGHTGVVGLQVVTVGSRIGEETARMFEAGAYRDYLELHGLSLQLAEALAEYWHARVRCELGIIGITGGGPDALGGMFPTEYQGCRYSLGYPACPGLEDRAKTAGLLGPERIGVRLSEAFQLHPEQSADAIVLHHPEASYFNAGGRA